MSQGCGKGNDVSSLWTGLNEDADSKGRVRLPAFSCLLRHSLQKNHEFLFIHSSVVHLVSLVGQMSMRRPKLGAQSSMKKHH